MKKIFLAIFLMTCLLLLSGPVSAGNDLMKIELHYYNQGNESPISIQDAQNLPSFKISLLNHTTKEINI